MYAYTNKHSLRSSTKGYGSKTYYTDSQNSSTTAPSGTELCPLQFSLQASSPETFGYTSYICVLDPEKVKFVDRNFYKAKSTNYSEYPCNMK
jgi:hypothetical protein